MCKHSNKYYLLSWLAVGFTIHPAGITCSKLTIETLEKDVEYVQSQQ